MELDELKSRLVAVSDGIEKLIQDFESATGTTITSVDLNRIDVSTIVEQRSILNVNVRVEL